MKFPIPLYALAVAGQLAATATLQAGEDIQAIIERAAASGQKEVVVPPGEYRIHPSKKGAHLSFRKINGLTVQAQDVKVICERAMSALEIVDCKDLTIRGLTIDYDPVLNTQGVAEAVNPAEGTLIVKIDQGYPCSDVYGFQIQTFDPQTRLLKKDSVQINKARAEELAERRLLIRTDNMGALKTISPGDLVAIDRQSEGPSHGILVNNSEHVVFENVTLHGAPSFGVAESQGEGGHEYHNFRITPGPKPAGAVTERLRSISDDGIHSISVKKGPLIDGCLIERHGDDGIAIHGSYHLVIGTTGKTVRLGLKREAEFAVGDVMTFYHPDASLAGEARVVRIGHASPATAEDQEVIKAKIWPLVMPIFQTVADIELDSEVKSEPGSRAVSRDRCGNGFVIRNTTVRDHRARGILVKASQGVIENNTVDNSSIAGIVLAPEFQWMEADYSSDVKITGNTIRHTGSDAPNASRSQAGAISVTAEGLDNKLAPAGGHKNILIADNTVESCRGAGLVVTSAQDVRIAGNRFEQIETGHFGSRHGITDNAVIWIDKVDDVFLENNSVPTNDGIVIGSAVTRQQVQNQ